MMAFDAVKRNVCVVKRETTSSPLQALILMNGPQFVEASRILAEDLIRLHGNAVEAAIGEAFLRLTGRETDERQAAILRILFDEQLDHFQAHPDEAAAWLKTGHRKADAEIDPARLAAVGVLVNGIMNLDLSVMKR
jgi:hypothetical protein